MATRHPTGSDQSAAPGRAAAPLSSSGATSAHVRSDSLDDPASAGPAHPWDAPPDQDAASPRAWDDAPTDVHATRARPWESPGLADSHDEGPPQIGRFVVLRELGRGAMGVVYAAYDAELDRKVALKLVHLQTGADASLGRNQLLREAQALARLTDPHVVAVHEAGVHRGAVFIAMEYVEGVDLQRWLAARPRSWREIVGVFRQAGAGLAAAHRVGLIHRDFKPGNVLVGADGRVRVADFGLATGRPAGPPGHVQTASSDALASHRLAETLGTGSLVGTPAYMAPEQLRREPATAACDQFSFCVALYEALHGRRPFAGDTLDDLAEQVATVTPPPPPPGSPVPAWLHALVVRGLARDPARRLPDMPALLAELARDPEAERRRLRRRVLQLAAVVALTLLVVLGVAAIWRALVASAHERRAATRLELLRGQLEGLRARGDDDEAARVFAAFVELPDNRGTSALAAAYGEWGAAQRDVRRGDRRPRRGLHRRAHPRRPARRAAQPRRRPGPPRGLRRGGSDPRRDRSPGPRPRR